MSEKFMGNFNQGNSNKLKRKLILKVPRINQIEEKVEKHLYNEKGIHILSGKDMCDCLDEDCPGCFFPCERCRSVKCGLECRVKRDWMHDYSEVEGLEFVRIKNKLANAE